MEKKIKHDTETEVLDSLVPYYTETVLGKTEHMTTLEKTRDDALLDCEKQPINLQPECYKTANLNCDISSAPALPPKAPSRLVIKYGQAGIPPG
jgi:hypothetical protein